VCAICANLTVGLQVADVANGEDEQRQHIYNIWSKAKKRVTSVFAWSLIVGAVVSLLLFFTTWWFVFLVPITVAMAIAVPIFTAGIINARIGQLANRHLLELPKPVSEQMIEKLNSAFIDPFLRRNEMPLGTIPPAGAFLVSRLKSLDRPIYVLIAPKELHMLQQILAASGVMLWDNSNSAEVVLNAFALKNDYSLFKERIEHHESTGMSVLAAYVSLVTRDEGLLPFLQQFLAERGMPESASSLPGTLEQVRHQFQLRGFAKDLEQRRHLSMSLTLEMVDAMNPYNFELLLGMMYEAQGYRFIETPKSGDQGADVLLERAGESTVVQAKLYSHSVGNEAVQEAIAARSHFRCHAAKVVTNNYFTRSARELAQSSDVELIGRDELAQMISEFNKSPKDYSRLAVLMKGGTSVGPATN